jgi:hypothetical protein
MKSGLTARAKLDGSVQGVVVHAKNLTVGSLFKGKEI